MRFKSPPPMHRLTIDRIERGATTIDEIVIESPTAAGVVAVLSELLDSQHLSAGLRSIVSSAETK